MTTDIDKALARVSEAVGRPILSSDLESLGFVIQLVDQIGDPQIQQVLKGKGKTVFYARRTTSQLRKELRKLGVSYLDLRGNLFVNSGDLPFLVERSSAKSSESGESRGTAFGRAGLRVVFQFLADPQALSLTYRSLAAHAGVSVRTVKLTVDDLERQGFVDKIGRGRGMRRSVRDRERLGHRWAMGYAEFLRPRLVIGTFRFLDAEIGSAWSRIDLGGTTAWWGGEPAAAMFGHPIRPQVLTLYSVDGAVSVARKLKLVPDPQGPVELVRAFWKAQPTEPPKRAVSRILVCADLKASGAPRNREVAKIMFQQWLNETG